MASVSPAQRGHLRRIARNLDAVEAEALLVGGDSEFEEWLRVEFLPSARKAAKEADLPPRSEVWHMALKQFDGRPQTVQARRLTALLREFDELVESYPRKPN